MQFQHKGNINMRYVLNFNSDGTELLCDGFTGGELLFERLKKPLKNGTTTKVRVTYENDGHVPFTARNKTATRFGGVVSSDTAVQTGIDGDTRYKLHRTTPAGSWFHLVPDSLIKKTSSKIEGPGVSVSLVNG